MKKYIGIDPGLKGGIAIIDDEDIGRIELHIMPVIGDKDYDIQALKNILRLHRDAALVVVERQQCMPGEGLSRVFKTGSGFGILLGLLAGLELRYDVVPPQKWQRQLYVGMRHGQDPKVSSEIVAKRLFPTADFRRSERAHVAADGLTDAACIAEFARRTMRGSHQHEQGKDHLPNPDNKDICLNCGAYLPVADEACYAK